MGIELGRIGGPLLARDLVRKNSGVGEENLAFETDLLYLDVINGKVGINTDSPSAPRKLDINGTASTTDLIVPTQFSTPNFVLSTNRIQNLASTITLRPDQSIDPKITTDKVGTLNLRISDRLIENITTNSNIELSPNGSGQTSITTSEVHVSGDLHATGDITWDGDITFGSDDSDNVEFKADVKSHIVPDINQTYDLATLAKRWDKIYTKSLVSETLTYSSPIVNVSNINLLLRQGNTYYVSVNGNDSYVGDHMHNTFRSVKHALSQTVAGDTVIIFPGTYEEIFPLTVPAGVTVNGAGIRAVTITPTSGTIANDCFLLNGETTVSNLSIKDFLYDPVADTGYGFRFATGCTISTRSPYVQNVSIITGGP